MKKTGIACLFIACVCVFLVLKKENLDIKCAKWQFFKVLCHKYVQPKLALKVWAGTSTE